MKKDHSLFTLYIIGFLFSLHTALIVYSNSSFLHQFIPESYTGLLYSAGSMVSILGLIIIPKTIARFGSRTTMVSLLLVTIGICVINIFAQNAILILIAFCILFAVNTMFYLANDILVDQFAHPESMGATRGNYLTALNIGYVIAPTITGFIMARMGFPALYTLAALILIPLLFILIKNPTSKHVHISKVNIWTSLRHLYRDSDLRNIAIANFILQFFYAWMVIYSPIFLHDQLGIPWDSIGTIFSIMLFAFVLTQIPFGRIADKYLGEKRLLIVGFILIGTTTSLLFFLPYFTLPLLALILFGTRIGASCIEVLTESYFFKKVDKTEAGEMSIFRNTYPVAYIIAPIIAGGILQILPIQYLFLILGIIMLLGIFFVIPIQDTK